MATGLVLKYAAGEKIKIGTICDTYPRRADDYKVGLSIEKLNTVLGTEISEDETKKILDKLNFRYEKVVPINNVLKIAPTLLGVPYKYGASISYDAPRAFDCSSFVAYLFVQSGVAIPRVTVDQFLYGKEIMEEDLAPVDVVFAQNSNDGEKHEFMRESDGKIMTQNILHKESKEFLPGRKIPQGIDHNGIYLGDGKIIHASGKWHKGKVVVESIKDSPAFSNIKGYRKMVENEISRFVVTVPPKSV